MKILFICTHNRCRSILAEAISNHFSDHRITAKSAGSQPVGEVHPLSLKYLKQAGISTDNLQSQSWDEFEHWKPDVVITVCDSAAGEQCPIWFDQTIRVHWGLVDPSRIEGSEEEIARGFNNTISILEKRIQLLMNEDFNNLNATDKKILLEKVVDC